MLCFILSQHLVNYIARTTTPYSGSILSPLKNLRWIDWLIDWLMRCFSRRNLTIWQSIADEGGLILAADKRKGRSETADMGAYLDNMFSIQDAGLVLYWILWFSCLCIIFFNIHSLAITRLSNFASNLSLQKQLTSMSKSRDHDDSAAVFLLLFPLPYLID